jgi:hypothetical protein
MAEAELKLAEKLGNLMSKQNSLSALAGYPDLSSHFNHSCGRMQIPRDMAGARGVSQRGPVSTKKKPRTRSGAFVKKAPWTKT